MGALRGRKMAQRSIEERSRWKGECHRVVQHNVLAVRTLNGLRVVETVVFLRSKGSMGNDVTA